MTSKPLRTPVPHGTEFEEEDAALISRLQAKVKALPPTSQVQEHIPLKGISDVLRKDAWVVTEQEVLEAAGNSVTHVGSDPRWDDLTKQMMRASCAFFAQEVLTGDPDPPYHGKFLLGDHHLEWDELIAKHKRICVLASRDSGKSHTFSFAYPLWRMVHKKNERGYIFSATQPQASDFLEKVKHEIETNPKLQWLLPTERNKAWGSSRIRTSNGNTLYARGYGTKVRGGHPQYIIVDDVLNDETAYSDVVRTKQTEYFFNAVSNMLTPTGQLIVVGTPMSGSDLYSELRHNSQYVYKEYPAESAPGEPGNKPLWADRYSLQTLKDKKEEIGSIRYAREFLCVPVSDESSLFPTYLFKGDPVEQFNVKLGMPLEYWADKGVMPYMATDFAMSTSVQADYTVVWTMGVDSHGNRWIIDIQRAKGLPFQQQLSLINQVGRKYDPALIYLEDNQMQRIFGDELIRTSDHPIKKFTTGVQKHSLEHGLPSLRVLLENHKVRIPRGDAHSVEMTDLWINEMRGFTWDAGKVVSVASHDDTVMSMWICDQAIKQGGFQFTFGDEAEYKAGDMSSLMDELVGNDTEAPKDPKDPIKGKASNNLVDDSERLLINLPTWGKLGNW